MAKIMPNTFRLCLLLVSCFTLLSCNNDQQQAPITTKQPAFPSTYLPDSTQSYVIEHATVLTGTGKQLEDASVYVEKGKIKLVGQNFYVPANVTRYDGNGKWVTPGLIDVHSHLGVYPSPSIESSQDGNEMTNPVTAEVWAEHSVWTQDPVMKLALAGGVTTFQVLPGSGNLIGGRGVTLKNVHSLTVQGMKFPGAPHSLKMACGENPKRVYGEQGMAPSTRMGNVAGYRNAWIEAQAYRLEWDDYLEQTASGEAAEQPPRNLRLETLAEVLRGNIMVHNHCYRAEEMMIMIDLAQEFNYKIAAFHHAVEAFKITKELAAANICAAVWADWWGFKHEAYDHVKENAAMLEDAKACAIIHSDSEIGIQHLNQEAAKSMAAGNKNGLSLEPKHVINWITSNPAKAIGVEKLTGSLQEGLMADMVIWSGNPFSIMSKVEKVFIDGVLEYDRESSSRKQLSDFDIGILDPEGNRL